MTGAGNTETVVVIRAAARDRFGDPVPGSEPEFDLPGCLFAPGASTESGLGANQVDTDAALYTPPGADIRATDRIRARGDEYQVVGKPQVWGTAGLVVHLRQVTG